MCWNAVVRGEHHQHDAQIVRSHERLADVLAVARTRAHALDLLGEIDERDGELLRRFLEGRGHDSLASIARAVYADDLRRIARERALVARPVAGGCARIVSGTTPRAVAPRSGAYRRAIRDLLGSGEGIYGLVDGYPPDVAGAPPSDRATRGRLAMEHARYDAADDVTAMAINFVFFALEEPYRLAAGAPRVVERGYFEPDWADELF